MKLKELIQLDEEDKSKYNTLNLVRVGGLSATPHDVHYKERKEYFHTPPTKKGTFVFLDGYIDRDLYKWKYREQKNLKMKKFPYKGKIWTHIKVDHKDVEYYRTKGSWYETDTNSLRKIFSLSAKKFDKPDGKTYGKSPQYELFIDSKNIGGI